MFCNINLKNVLQIILLITIFSCSSTKNPNKFQLGLNEIEHFYSENFTNPKSIEFVFSGNPRYIDYYFTNLKKHLSDRFSGKDVNFCFRYINSGNVCKSDKNSYDYLLNLDINNSTIINEKNGYDRTMKFDFKGNLINNETLESEFNFKSVVLVIHDINNKNDDVAEYLFTKLFSE